MADKFYAQWTHSDLSGQTAQNIGWAKIYRNSPVFLIKYDYEWNGAKFWWKLNDQSITSEDKLDDASYFTIWYGLENTGNPNGYNFGASGNQTIKNDSIYINPILPWGTKVSSGSKGSTRPTTGTDKSFSSYHKGWIIWWAFGDQESFAMTFSGTLKDNYFCRYLSSYSVDRANNRITFNMSTSLPSLINADKGDVDIESSDRVACSTDKKFTVSLDSNKHYRLENSWTNPSKSSNDEVSTSISNISLYNDNIYINSNQLASISTFSRNNKVLSWNAISNAGNYKIYVDNEATPVATVSTTSWTIPDDLYIDQKHTYSIEVCDRVVEQYENRSVRGKKTSSAGEESFFSERKSTFTVYKGVNKASHANWTNVGVVNAPTVTPRKLKLNSWTFSVSHTVELGTPRLYYKVITTDDKFTSDTNGVVNGVVTLNNLKVNTKYDIYFYVTSTIGTTEHWSDATIQSITPTKLPAPTISSVQKTAINTYTVNYSSTTRPDRYEVYLNEDIIDGDASTSISIPGWKAAQKNKITITAVYDEDQSYNNTLNKDYGAEYTPILSTPTLSKKDIRENDIEQGFGDAGSKEIIDNVVTQVELSWTAPEYSSGYVLYDHYKVWNNDIQDWEEGDRIYPTQNAVAGTDYMNTTVYRLYMNNVMGYHDYSIRAIASVDESYNSSVSNVIHLEQNFPLDPPIITGDDTSTTISFEKVKNADFYSIQLIPTRGTVGNLFRSFLPDKYPYSYNYYDMVKDLEETETFDVSVFSRSYNAFYFHPSADSNHKTCRVVKLETPVNLTYDDKSNTLYWTGDDRAFEYEVKIKAIDGDWATYITKDTKYRFENLAPSLYVCYVTALRDDSLTNHQIVYLDSTKSENLTFGLINTPRDFARHVNKFSWTGVGADRYIFYEWVKQEAGDYVLNSATGLFDKVDNGTGDYSPVSMTTVDGGGVSLELGMVDGAKYRPTEGIHFYSVQAATSIENTNYDPATLAQFKDGVVYSLLTDPIMVEIEYLKKLQPKFTQAGYSHIDWEHLNNDVQYDTRINNLSERDLSDENRYSLDKNVAGTYYFKVRSISTVDQFLYQTSTWSDELIYNVYKLPRPEIRLTKGAIVEGAMVQWYFDWDDVPNAGAYRMVITKQGEEPESVDVQDSHYEIGLGEGSYSAYVIALSSGTRYLNPKYINSDNSNIMNFGKLEEPVISITDNIITWQNDELADYYEIYNYNKLFAQVDDPMYILDVSKPYSYSIRVRSVSLEELVVDSDLSNTIEYVVTQLAPPANVRLSTDDVLSWGESINADSYRIFVDDNLVAVTSASSINLKRILEELAGVVRIYVVAFSNKLNYLDSEDSNYVLKRIEKAKRYNIVIDGVNYDEIQLPFTINETLDETLDKAELTLAYINRKEPFERLTPAAVIIYEGAQSSKTYKMIVESDMVTEIQIGTEIKYKHKLQLIERTLILQNEIIPDFTVSTSIGESLNMRGEILIPTIGKNQIPGRDLFNGFDTLATGTYNEYTIKADGALKWVLDKLGIPTSITIPLGFVWFFGLGDCVKGNLRKNYMIGDAMPLPIPTSRLCCFHFSIQEIFFEMIEEASFGGWVDIIKSIYKAIIGEGSWYEVLFYIAAQMLGGGTGGAAVIKEMFESTKTDDDWPYPGRNYYIRPHRDSYDKSNDEQLIYSVGAGFKITNPSYTFQKEGVYDLVMEIPAVNFQDLNDKGMIGFDADYFQGSGAEVLPKKVDFMKDEHGHSTPFRMVWPNINVVRQIEETQFVSIADVLEKISVMTGNKFKIDPAILAITRTKKCPDMTFSNGNYIYDALEEIGREFSGIPRLLDDNTITFDILDEYTTADRNINGWKDVNVLSAYGQEIDKVTSGFVSRISNMVPDDDYTIYPAPGMWTTPRGEKNSTALVDVDNLAIVVDKPIYKIKQVIVKNAIKEEPELEIDLTNYIYQDVVYDALNDNNYGKGMALSWKQGDRCIRGLGQIPEATKFYAIMGWKEDDYVIQNIIQYHIDMNMNQTDGDPLSKEYTPQDPQKMLFRIEYQGYTDTTVYLENSDKRDNKYTMYTVFNQESNTVTDSRFGHGALTQLKRHGGKEIQKKYTCYSIVSVPNLGTSIEVDGITYYLDDVQYVFHNKYTEANCTFTKNYNKVNPRVAINSEYRQYELRADNNVDRIINFNKYCYVGAKDNRHTKLDFENWQKIMTNGFSGNTSDKPDSYYFNCYDNIDLEKLSFLSYDKNGTIMTKRVNGIAKPVSYSRIGTSVMFTAKMDDAFTAGQNITARNLKEFGYNPKDDKMMIQNYVRYVNDNSFDQTPYMRVTIGSIPNSIKSTAMDSYPDVKWLEQPKTSMKDALFSNFFKVYKDQREALGFNYQMHFISNREDLFIHKGFTKYLLKNPNQPVKGVKPIVVGFKNSIRNKDIYDSIYTTMSEVSMTGNSNQVSLDLNLRNHVSDNDYNGLAIIWPDTKEIILEIKMPIAKGSLLNPDKIWFNFSNEILK